MDVANAFLTSHCPEGDNVRLASCLLKDRDWWEEVGHAVGDDVIDGMTWDDFSTKFQADFAPVIKVQQLVREMVVEITAIFGERALLVPQYVIHEEMKKERYHDMLKSDIRQFVSRSSWRTPEDMIMSDREREIDLEMERKRKTDQAQDSGGSSKMPKVLD